MDFRFLARWQPQLLAILRIVVGLLFLEHALIKLIGFPPGGKPGLQHVASFLWIAGVIELVTRSFSGPSLRHPLSSKLSSVTWPR